MSEKFLKAARIEQALISSIPNGSRGLLGVSGGIDSMVMLDCVASLIGRLKIHVEVAHLDHGIRSDSKSDAEFVREECAKRGLPCHLKSVVPQGKGINIEDWGRRERYSFFREVRLNQGLEWVATAHTANDVAETLLIKLISNKELTSIAVNDERRKLIRPLLKITRKDIEEYAARHKVDFRTDATNADTNILRNRVRIELIPFLQTHFETGIIKILSDRAAALQSDEETLRNLVLTHCHEDDILEADKSWRIKFKEKLAVMPEGIQWRAVRAALKDKLGFNLGRKRCLEVVDLVLGKRVGVELPGGLRLRSHEGGIIFEKACD